MEFENVTITTKAIGSKKSKTREYPAQIVIIEDYACFYIMMTKRQIKLKDNYDLSEIATVTFNDHVYLVNNFSTIGAKSKYPILEASKIA